MDYATKGKILDAIYEKILAIESKSWLLMGAVAVILTVLGDAFFWMWSLLATAALIDWVVGRMAVRMMTPELFSIKKSREGLYGKAIGLTILALLRSMESILPSVIQVDVPDTHGLLSSLIAVALFIDELDSIAHHRESLGKPPIPLLGWALEHVRGLTGAERRKAARIKAMKKKRRKTDPR